MRIQSLWCDPERRRAVLLSIIVHLLFVLGLVIWTTIPKETQVDRVIVIEVSGPVEAAFQAPALSVDSSAEDYTPPQLLESEVSIIQAKTVLGSGPTSRNPDSPNNSGLRGVPAREQREMVNDLIEEEVVTSSRVDVSDSPMFGRTSQRESLDFDLPRDIISTTTLPEIEFEQLAERVSKDLINIPVPLLMVQVSNSQVVATLPTDKEVVAGHEVLNPELEVVVSNPIGVPTPQVKIFGVSEEVILFSSPSVELTGVQNVPLPEVASAVVGSMSIPQFEVYVDISPDIFVPVPEITPVASGGIAVRNPDVEVYVSTQKNIPDPNINVFEFNTRDENIVPRVDPLAQFGANSSADVVDRLPEEKSLAERNHNDYQEGEIDSLQSVQAVSGSDAASDDPAVIASSDFIRPMDGSSGIIDRSVDEEIYKSPLIVLLDNVEGYPQSGIVEAGQVVEMPVEGGLTRLMAIYEKSEPYKVGPIRSARDYFLRLAIAMRGILVHDGGSPDALMAITKGNNGIRTFNAQSRGDLFYREEGREAPYNLYSFGRELRVAIRELDLEHRRLLNVSKYSPSGHTQVVSGLDIAFSSDYTSGFVYQKSDNQYRWVRNGQKAVDSTGKPALVEAVLVGEIKATRRPSDTEGRLDILLGDASYQANLFVNGVEVLGNWYQEDGLGIQFVAADGNPIDLRSLKIWVVLTPTYGGLKVR